MLATMIRLPVYSAAILLSLANLSHADQGSPELLPELVKGLIPGLTDHSQTSDLFSRSEEPESGPPARRAGQLDHHHHNYITEPHLSKKVRDKASAFDLWDEHLLLDIIPIVLGQRSCNENGTYEKYRERLLNDHSNDDIMSSSPEEIIERSGFDYERHESISDDGYSTELLRLKNPLMHNRPLKQRPVMLLQSGAISPTVFIGASSAQHHPELASKRSGPSHQSRAELDQQDFHHEHPILSLLIDPLASQQERELHFVDESHRRSSNRSLAFMLANRGYDIWIVESRGHRGKMLHENPLEKVVDRLEKTSKSIVSLLFGSNRSKNMTLGESVIQFSRAPHYWTYSFDEIIHHQIRNQIKKVLEVSGAHNVTLVSYSFSSMITLPFLASRPKFARKRVHNLVLMAPIVSNRGANTLFNYLYRNPCLHLPDDLIAFFGTGRILTRPLRKLFIKIGNISPRVRYKLLKFMLYLFQGPSAHYRTFLEPALFGHFFEPTSLLQVKHFCQQVLARKYQRYNFGPLKNLLVYGQEEPPVYNISRINLRPAHWLLISGEEDNLGTKDSAEQLLREVNPKPADHIQVPGYAHLDLVAGVDNDLQVNLPILDYLERHRYYLD